MFLIASLNLTVSNQQKSTFAGVSMNQLCFIKCIQAPESGFTADLLYCVTLDGA